MDKNSQKTAFTLRDLQRAEMGTKDNAAKTIATKDNVEPRPHPPFHIQRPNLAPPGMAGVRSSVAHNQNLPPAARPTINPSPAQRPTLNREIGKPSEVNKEFKAIAEKTPVKDHTLLR